MAHVPRIRTPLRQHWNRFRLGALPVICFLACIAATLWLWERPGTRSSLVGEIQALQINVTAGISGRLSPPEGVYWRRHDHVKKGEVIAQFDGTATQAALQTVTEELTRLTLELASARANLRLDSDSLTQNHVRNRLNVDLEYDQRRLEYLQLNADLTADEAAYTQAQALLETMDKLGSAQLITNTRLLEARQNAEVLKARIAENKKVVAEAKKQGTAALKRKQELPPLELPEEEAVLAPVRAAMVVQEARMKEIRIQIDALVVRSPIDGVISAINRWPDQEVRAGDTILTVARTDAAYVISYVREQEQVSLAAGMEVTLRLRTPGSDTYTGVVETVGPAVEPVPAHQLKDQAIPEWGTPITIRLPDELQQGNLRPSELVQVIFTQSDRK